MLDMLFAYSSQGINTARRVAFLYNIKEVSAYSSELRFIKIKESFSDLNLHAAVQVFVERFQTCMVGSRLNGSSVERFYKMNS